MGMQGGNQIVASRPPHIAPAAPLIFAARFNVAGMPSAFWLSALTPALGNLTPTGDRLSVQLGSDGNAARYLNGTVAELFIAQGILEDVELARAMGYLSSRYAIQVAS